MKDYIPLVFFIVVLLRILGVGAGDIYLEIKCHSPSNSCSIRTYKVGWFWDSEKKFASLEKEENRYVGFDFTEDWSGDLYFYPELERLDYVDDNGRHSYWTCRLEKEEQFWCK